MSNGSNVFRRELGQRLNATYGSRHNWPAGVGMAAASLYTWQQYLTDGEFAELLADFDVSGSDAPETPAAPPSAETELARRFLAAMRRTLTIEAFDVLIGCACQAHKKELQSEVEWLADLRKLQARRRPAASA